MNLTKISEKKSYSYLFLGLALLYMINVISTFFRYSEAYILISTKWNKMNFIPNYWSKNWKYAPILQLIDPHEEGIAVETDTFDRLHYDFALYPRQLIPFSWPDIPKYQWIIVNKNSPLFTALNQTLKELQWDLLHFHQGKDEYQVWKKNDKN